MRRRCDVATVCCASQLPTPLTPLPALPWHGVRVVPLQVLPAARDAAVGAAHNAGHNGDHPLVPGRQHNGGNSGEQKRWTRSEAKVAWEEEEVRREGSRCCALRVCMLLLFADQLSPRASPPMNQ